MPSDTRCQHIPCDRGTRPFSSQSQPHPLWQHQQHQATLRQRRRRVQAKAAFQNQLNQALSVQAQTDLGITVQFDGQFLAQPSFVAQFEFLGKHWLLACQRKLFGWDWFFKRADTPRLSRCSPQTLEYQLLQALDQYHNQVVQHVQPIVLDVEASPCESG